MGQRRIVDFFMKKATADLIRDSGKIKNQGAANSPLLGASGSGASKLTSDGDTDPHPEVRGG